MGRLVTFFAGMIVGAALLWGVQHYHVVNSSDGVVLVPKLRSNFSNAYVDITEFTIADWAEHKELAAALIQANKEHLMQDTAEQQLRDGIRTALESLGTRRE